MRIAILQLYKYYTYSRDGCIQCFYLKVIHNIVYREPFLGMCRHMCDLTIFDVVVERMMIVKVELTDG